MQKENCFYLGKITKKHGFKGDCIMKLDTDSPEQYHNLESAFIEINQMLIPYFFSKCLLQQNNTLRLKIEDIEGDAVETFIGKAVYLPLTLLPNLKEDQFYYHEIIDYQVFNNQTEEIGTLEWVNDTGPQAFFEIRHQSGKKILLPVQESFIENIDKQNKKLYVKAPAGLIDLYLSA